ncbi:ASCH domain-containing protein OS=Streptomyces glaucescens OX=1907 GN=SGLAU_32625 PE=4 SV=1 [Streptomyces glaucescens]
MSSTPHTRALTIRQPWAGAIAHQTKRVENRSWKLPAKHTGARTLIHAGAQRDRDAQVYGEHLDVYSAIVAVATLSSCHWSDDGTCCGPWGFERVYHWTLTDVVALPEPIPASGRLGIWTPAPALAEQALAQVEEVGR